MGKNPNPQAASLPPRKLTSRQRLLANIWRYRYIYLMILPGLIWLIVFSYVPMYGVQLAFKTFRGNIWTSPWVGLDNFRLMFLDPDFFRAFRNTVTLSVMKLVLTFPLPILLAISLNEIHFDKFKRVLQTIFTFPNFLSWIIVASIIKNLLGSTGLISNIMVAFGGDKLAIFQNPQQFRWMLILSEVWKGVGWSCIMYLAAIASIGPELYESAVIDGANRRQRMWHITWPGIQNMVAMMLILALGGLVGGNFDQIFNLYNGVVFDTADILGTYIYRATFAAGNTYGFATAVGLFTGLINAAMLITANVVTKKLTGSGLL
jgi:putative aldouronate transport system permease protein